MNDDRKESMDALAASLAAARSEIAKMQELHAALGGAMGVVPIQTVLQQVVDEAMLFQTRYGVDDRAGSIGDEARKLMAEIPSLFKAR